VPHHAHAIEIELALELPFGLIPPRSLVDREADVLRSREHLVRVTDHRLEVLHRLRALHEPLAIASDMLHAQHHIAVRGKILRLGEVRVPVAARAMRDHDYRERPAARRQVHLDGDLPSRGNLRRAVSRQKARSLTLLRGRLHARGVRKVGVLQDVHLRRGDWLAWHFPAPDACHESQNHQSPHPRRDAIERATMNPLHD